MAIREQGSCRSVSVVPKMPDFGQNSHEGQAVEKDFVSLFPFAPSISYPTGEFNSNSEGKKQFKKYN